MEPVIFFTSPPNFEELCGVTVLVKPSVQPQFASVQPHITKCREVIFTEPDVIASPSYDLDACFNIVMQQSLFKSGRVQARLLKLGCQLSKPYRVLPSLYQACLHYTILARLAPVWNRTGEWLIQGRDFLMHTGYTHAIKLRLCVNKDEIFVSVYGTVVKFPPLQVEDLNLSREEMLQIVKSTEDRVSEVMLADCWCHVLPSMKRGRIMSVSLLISSDSPFTCYRDLQRHWKNMYGYRLPDTDEDILYCKVCFLPSGGGKHFTYPSVCLRAGPLQMIQRVDPKPILTTFLQDLHSRVGAVCGTSLKFQPKICYACPSLHMAGKETSRTSLSSIPVSKPIAPLRSQKSMSHLYSATNIDKKTTLRKKLYEQRTEKMKDDMSLVNVAQTARRLTDENQRQVQENPCKGDLNSNTDRKDTNIQIMSQQDGTVDRTSQQDDTENAICHSENHTAVDQKHHSQKLKEMRQSDSEHYTNTQPKVTTKFVPHFRPKQRCHSDTKQADSESSDRRVSKLSSFIPVFKPRFTKTTSSSRRNDKIEAQSTEVNTAIYQSPSSKLYLGKSKTNSARASEQDSSRQPLPASVLHFRNNLKHKCLKGARTKLSLLKTSIDPLPRDFNIATERTIQQNPRSIMKSPNNSGLRLPAQRLDNILQTPVHSSASLACEPHLTPVHSSTFLINEPHLTPVHSSASLTHEPHLTPVHSSASLTRGPHLTFIPFSKNSQETNGWCKDGTQDGAKRKKVTEGEDTPNKPRVKPQIQNIDVEALARANQLGKVNAVTLTAWLKDRGVMCRSKDKKNDLVEKVNSYINAAKPEK